MSPSPAPPRLETDALLPIAVVADLLNVHVSTVYRLVDSGRLQAHALGEGKVRRRGLRVWRSSVDALLTSTAVAVRAA